MKEKFYCVSCAYRQQKSKTFNGCSKKDRKYRVFNVDGLIGLR